MTASAPFDQGASAATAAVTERLAAIPDPELPVVSIVDLGMVHRVTVTGDDVRVTILPTFIGCPAQDVIRAAIVDGPAAPGRTVVVETSFEVPWTSDRISAAGRASESASSGMATGLVTFSNAHNAKNWIPY